MSPSQVGGGTVVVAAGVVVTGLAVVRLVALGGRGTDSDGPSTARVDRIAAAVLLAGLGLLLIAIGLLWG